MSPPLVIMKRILNTIVFALLLIAVLGVPAPAPSMVVVVYESSESPLDPYVVGALKELSVEGLQTRMIDRDVITGGGEVPSQVQVAISSATQLPSLSLLSGDKLISSQPLPATYEGILEAVR